MKDANKKKKIKKSPYVSIYIKLVTTFYKALTLKIKALLCL